MFQLDEMRQKLLFIGFAVIIFAAVLTGAFLLLRKIFPSQVEQLPIIGGIGSKVSPTPIPSGESKAKEATDGARADQTPGPVSAETPKPTPTPVPTPTPTPTPAAQSPVSTKGTTANSAPKTRTTTTTTTTQASSGNSAFRVVNLTINSSPANWSGSCPKDVNFLATITVNGSGEVKYRFIRSDGSETSERTISFDYASSKNVEDTWNRSGGSGFAKIKIISPNSVESSGASFNINCN